MDIAQDIAHQILLVCARSQGEPAGLLRSLVQQGVDWAYLLDLAARHKLLPLACARLRQDADDLIPLDVRDHLWGRYVVNALFNMRLQTALAEVVTALERVGIEPIVLKGAALAGTIYADPGQRPMGDVDLMVRPGQMELAGRELTALGFPFSGGLPARMVAFQQRFGGGLGYVGERLGQAISLDLQDDLTGVDFCRHAFPIEPDALWAAARPLDLEHCQSLQLSPVDTLTHLCLHLALQHCYAVPLICYVDIDRLVAAEADDEFWHRLVARASRFRLRIVVYQGLRTARDLLGTPVPAGTLTALAPGAPREGLLDRLAPLDPERVWAGSEQQPSGLHQLLLYAGLMERPTDALRMVRAILFPGREWLGVRYGLQKEWQARLYALVHPFRVARAFLRGLVRPLKQSGLE